MAHRVAPRAETNLDEIWLYVAQSGSIEVAGRLIDSITQRLPPSRRLPPRRSRPRR